MKKKLTVIALMSVVVLFNGCHSVEKNKDKKVEVVEEIPIVKIEAPAMVAASAEPVKVAAVAVVAETDTDKDGIPDYLDTAPKQHIKDTIVEMGSQKLIILDNIKKDSDKLSPEMLKTLDNVAQVLSKEKNIQVIVTGHTCDLGTDIYNLDLSKKRALTANTYLKTRKVSEQRINVKWNGERTPIVKNDTEANRSKNRRVEVLFYEFDKTTKNN